MASVGNAASGMVLQGTGVNSGPTYEKLGVNSGLNANGVVISQNNAAFTATSAGTVGQVLTSNGSGVDPTFQTVSSGGLLPWTDETGSITMDVNNGYTTSSASLITLTLPAVSPYGSIFWIVGNGAGGWKVAQQAGQSIHFGTVDTTVGATGYIQSINSYDAVEILCTTANKGFTVISGPQGNITYN